eukprot:394342_1
MCYKMKNRLSTYFKGISIICCIISVSLTFVLMIQAHYVSYLFEYIQSDTYISDTFDLDEFNQQLLCPIKNNHHDDELYKKKMNFLNQILQIQFPQDCTTQKYLVINNACARGLFHDLKCWISYFHDAFIHNRTLIWNGIWPHAKQKYCGNTSTECFFLTVSNCTKYIQNIITQTAHICRGICSEYVNICPKNVGTAYLNYTQYDNNATIVHCKSSWGNKQLDGKQTKWYKHAFGLDESDFTAIMMAFFLRLRSDLSYKVNNIVMKSLQVGTYPLKFIPENSISIPVRWGDKCLNWHLNHSYMSQNNITATGGAEMICFTPRQYFDLLRELKYLIPNIDTLVITSESNGIVQEFNKYYKRYGFKHLITNIGDIMQGVSTTENLDIDPHKWFISMISTMRLLFSSKYFIETQGSAWIFGISNLIQSLDCDVIHPKYSTNVDMKINKRKCIGLQAPFIKRGNKRRFGYFEYANLTKWHYANKTALIDNELFEILQKSDQILCNIRGKDSHRCENIILKASVNPCPYFLL